MGPVIMEGKLITEEDMPERTERIVRLGPINVPFSLRETVQAMAYDEGRSVANTIRILVERGLKYTETMPVRRVRL